MLLAPVELPRLPRRSGWPTKRRSARGCADTGHRKRSSCRAVNDSLQGEGCEKILRIEGDSIRDRFDCWGGRAARSTSVSTLLKLESQESGDTQQCNLRLAAAVPAYRTHVAPSVCGGLRAEQRQLRAWWRWLWTSGEQPSLYADDADDADSGKKW